MEPDSRVWVAVGDVHGCLDELDELLKLVQYRPNQHRLLFCGDLVDRGPDPVGCVRRVIELGALCTQSNHDEKVGRWRAHEKRIAGTDRKNPMKVREDRAAQWRQFTDAEVEWLRNLPSVIRFGTRYPWLAVHAGLEWSRYPEQQPMSQVIRLRFVDKEGKYIPVAESGEDPKGEAYYWSEVWTGPESVVYGHAVHSLGAPRVDQPKPGVFCYGIDTGGCFGGRLTALLIDPMKGPSDCPWVQVQAHAQYSVLRDPSSPPPIL